ncbi:hypothetical protein L6452_25226 [Arctium lappa]|uniref:Uncharacterized protein n=1 Tax=Arctium lappa TaxID=4217 RepID=A0ACB9ABP0_ARCLA|nr:hypothetical protein L6452_25226 [Arctium lappa]
MRGLLAIIFLFVIPTFSITSATIPSIKLACILVPKWHIVIINNISEGVILHLKSRNDDLGNHTLPNNGSYDWEFCDTGQTVYSGEFRWGSKDQTLNLYDTHAWETCKNGKFFGTQHCYWLVRPEGFYIGKENTPFPNEGWHLEKSWP